MRHLVTEKLFSRLWHQFHLLVDFNWLTDWSEENNKFCSLDFFPLKHSNSKHRDSRETKLTSSPRNYSYAHEETFYVYKFLKIILSERSTHAGNVRFYPLMKKNLPCFPLRDFLRKPLLLGSLSSDVFERRTSTRRAYPDATKFVLLSFFALIQTIF